MGDFSTAEDLMIHGFVENSPMTPCGSSRINEIMKNGICRLMTLLFLGSEASGTAATGGEGFVSLTNSIVAVAAEKSPGDAIVLLEKIAGYNGWGFGGSVGPSDRSSLLITALTAFEPFLGWKSGGRDADFRIPGSKIVHWLPAPPSSVEAMSEMLKSTDPVLRWLACEKIVAFGSIMPELVPILHIMSQEDSYLRIIRLSSPRELNSVPQNYFDAPLRKRATDALRLAGVEAREVDIARLSNEGLVWLGRLYMEKAGDGDARFGIVSALRMLNPATVEIVAAQSRAGLSQSTESLNVLFSSLAGNGSKLPQLMVSKPQGTGASKSVIDVPQRSLEQRDYNRAKNTSTSESRRAHWLLAIGGIVALLLLFFVIYFWWHRKLARRMGAE